METAEELDDSERTLSVHYVRFHIDAAEEAAFVDRGTSVAVVVDHPRYSSSTELTPLQRAALAGDLAHL